MKTLKVLVAFAVLGGILAGCSSDQGSATDTSTSTNTAAPVTGKDNNAGGAQAVDQAVAAPPGVKTGTP